MRLDQALESYLLQLEADGRSVHTRLQYNRHVRAFAAWLGPQRDLDSITTSDVARFMVLPETTQKRSTGTLNALRTSLRTFFGHAHAAGYARTNPARMLRLALRTPAPPRGLSEDEVGRLMAVFARAQGPCARRDQALVSVMLLAGLRLGSALALDKSDIDLGRDEILVRVAKNQAPERVFISPPLHDRLVGYLAERGDGPLFTNRLRQRVGARHVQRRIEQWMAKAGARKGMSAHSMRHTFATRMYALTGDVLLVKEALRHRSIVSTLVYARPREADLRRAMEA